MAPPSPVMLASPVSPLAMPAIAAPPMPQRRSSNLALYLILGGLFLIALFLVVFFALKG